LKFRKNVKLLNGLCADFVQLWFRIWREADKRDEVFKQAQKERIFSQYGGMKDTDWMSKVLKRFMGKRQL
jgi:hypothetical protein